MNDHICFAKVVDGWHRYRCGKNAKFNENGKWYCGTHAPSRIAERAAKRAEANKPHEDARTEYYRRERAVKAACEGIPTEALEAGVVAQMILVIRMIENADGNGETFAQAQSVLAKLEAKQ